jgi:hypothetical protein
MQRFFKNFKSIEQFTLSLDYHQDTLKCLYCFKNDQFVSHGIVYKQRSIEVNEPVGKRIFCSNRYGRSGCGRTFQLMVAYELPGFQYGTAHLFLFITSLLTNLTVASAYQRATGQLEPRNAWRWLNRLTRRLAHYRPLSRKRPDPPSTRFKSRARRLQLLLPTLEWLFTEWTAAQNKDDPCSFFHLTHQRAFI